MPLNESLQSVEQNTSQGSASSLPSEDENSEPSSEPVSNTTTPTTTGEQPAVGVSIMNERHHLHHHKMEKIVEQMGKLKD